MMKKVCFVVMLLCLGCSMFGRELREDDFFKLSNLPKQLNVTLAVGEDIEFDLEENATTGYVWRAKYDPSICNINISHKHKGGHKMGAPGHAEIDIELLKPIRATVTFIYARPFDTGSTPKKSIVVTVKPSRRRN